MTAAAARRTARTARRSAGKQAARAAPPAALDALVEETQPYLPQTGMRLLRRAFRLASDSHQTQRRASGEPYIEHPLEVARILAVYRVDANTLAAALLHDTVEDSGVTLDQLREGFGAQVARMVDGVTKVSNLRLRPDGDANPENLHKLMLALAEDYRVLLIKLADRLHNMRTIKSLPDAKRRRIAQETLEYYAPLADRVGLQELREELEDRAFQVINAPARMAIMRRFVQLRRKNRRQTEQIAADLRRLLAKHGIEAEVIGRDKMPYSIWCKMQRKDIEFEHLSDISAFRVLVGEPLDCYRAMGVLHTNWPLVPERLKDHISVPKHNGYQSLHTTVVMPAVGRIEVQIRTREMHGRAESGVAAHWRYKSGAVDGPRGEPLFQPLREWFESVRESDTPEDSLAFVASEALRNTVYCFTPKGRIIHLPEGATPLDFAYAVHTEVGRSCVGAKVDGRRAPLSQPLKIGQQVEILRSSNAQPKMDDTEAAVTGRARNAIRRSVRDYETRRLVQFGESLAKAAFRNAGFEPTARGFTLAAKRLKLGGAKDLFSALGDSRITGREVVEAVHPPGSAGGSKAGAATSPHEILVGLSGDEPVEFATCCSPLPGERIVGIGHAAGGIAVHNIDCDVLAGHEGSPRWLDLKWNEDAGRARSFSARLEVSLANSKLAMAKLCELVGRHDSNIEDLAIVEKRPDFGRVQMVISVSSTRHLARILASLAVASVVADVRRLRGTDLPPAAAPAPKAAP